MTIDIAAIMKEIVGKVLREESWGVFLRVLVNKRVCKVVFDCAEAEN